MIRELNNPLLNPWEKKNRVRVLRVHKIFGLEIWECVYHIKGEKRKIWEQRAHNYYDAKSGLWICRSWDIWNRTKTPKELKKRLGEVVEASKSFVGVSHPEVLSMSCGEYLVWKIKRESERAKRKREQRNAIR